MTEPRLSIIIPTLNEGGHLPGLLADLRRVDTEPGLSEIIVVDAGSQDETLAIAREFGVRVLSSVPSRGGQLNAGHLASEGRMLWFLHADTRLGSTVWEALKPLVGENLWGRFNVQLGDEPVPTQFRIIASVMNLRSCLTSIATGDQGIFVSRDLLEKIGGVPDHPLMEDIELSLRLRRLAPPCCLRQTLQTSRRRWEERGLVPATLQMMRLRLAYARGVSAQSLAEIYYQRHA